MIALLNKVDQLLQFNATPSNDCRSMGNCYTTSAMQLIQMISSDHKHPNEVGLIVSRGRDYDGVTGWYPKAFHTFDQTETGLHFETNPLWSHQKTISSIISE